MAPGEISAQTVVIEMTIGVYMDCIDFLVSKQSVRNVQSQGRVCVLDIEIEGVKQIRATELNPLLVFILPPSIEELERRLRNRNTESEESLRKRLDKANAEIDYGKLNIFNFFYTIQSNIVYN